MRLTLIILTTLISSICFGQTEKIDTIKTISIKELTEYLTRVNVVAMKQFNLTEQNKYNEILKELQAILQEADKKRK